MLLGVRDGVCGPPQKFRRQGGEDAIFSAHTSFSVAFTPIYIAFGTDGDAPTAGYGSRSGEKTAYTLYSIVFATPASQP